MDLTASPSPISKKGVTWHPFKGCGGLSDTDLVLKNKHITLCCSWLGSAHVEFSSITFGVPSRSLKLLVTCPNSYSASLRLNRDTVYLASVGSTPVPKAQCELPGGHPNQGLDSGTMSLAGFNGWPLLSIQYKTGMPLHHHQKFLELSFQTSGPR